MSTDYFTIRLAGVGIGIKPRNNYMRYFCRRFIRDIKADFVVGASDKDIEEERTRMIEYMGRGDASEEELEQLCIYRQIAENMPKYGVFLVHAIALRVDEDGYLLAGPSGAGKTTHARLWKKELKDRMCVINDDKPLLKINDNKVFAYSSPWSGKDRWYNHISAPIKAVIFVNQAKENHIELMSREKSWDQMMNQIYKSTNADNTKRTLEFVNKTIEMIYFYSLSCNKSLDAARIAYEVASK